MRGDGRAATAREKARTKVNKAREKARARTKTRTEKEKVRKTQNVGGVENVDTLSEIVGRNKLALLKSREA